ncbi:hypothetical protein ACQP3L_34575, partial [Escherichia coli]
IYSLFLGITGCNLKVLAQAWKMLQWHLYLPDSDLNSEANREDTVEISELECLVVFPSIYS